MKFTKKITLLLFAALLLSSCFSTRAPQVNIGMTVQEFVNKAKYEELIRADNEWSVYRVRYGYHADGTMFYYFKNNELVKFNQGRLIPNYRVSINTY